MSIRREIKLWKRLKKQQQQYSSVFSTSLDLYVLKSTESEMKRFLLSKDKQDQMHELSKYGSVYVCIIYISSWKKRPPKPSVLKKRTKKPTQSKFDFGDITGDNNIRCSQII